MLSKYTSIVLKNKKVYFQSTQVYCRNTHTRLADQKYTLKVQCIVSKYKKKLSKYESILSNYTSILSKYKSILWKYKSILWKYKSILWRKKPKSKVVESAIWFNWFTCTVWGLCWYHYFFVTLSYHFFPRSHMASCHPHPSNESILRKNPHLPHHGDLWLPARSSGGRSIQGPEPRWFCWFSGCGWLRLVSGCGTQPSSMCWNETTFRKKSWTLYRYIYSRS